MRSYLLAALVLLAAVSCRRLIDSTAPNVYTAPRLAAVFTVDSTGGRADTVNREHITYDGQGRTLEIVDFDLNSPGDTSYFIRRHFEYGADTLATRSIAYLHYYGSGGYQRFDTISYRHQNGVLVYDSARVRTDNGDVETRVRHRTYYSSYIVDTILLVQESGGVVDSTRQVSRTWLRRVGPYVLRQLDSVSEQHNTPDIFYHRHDFNITPSIIPNPFYNVYRVVGDELVDHYQTAFIPAELAAPVLPVQTNYLYQFWAAGQPPATAQDDMVQFSARVGSDGFPFQITEHRGPGGSGQTVHYLLVYE